MAKKTLEQRKKILERFVRRRAKETGYRFKKFKKEIQLWGTDYNCQPPMPIQLPSTKVLAFQLIVVKSNSVLLEGRYNLGSLSELKYYLRHLYVK